MDSSETDLRRRNKNHSERLDGENNEGFSWISSTNTFSYGSANEYANAVRTWLWAYQTWHFSQFLTPIHVREFLFQQQQRLENERRSTNILQNGTRTIHTTVAPRAVTETRYIVPAFGRRILAEGIDFVICFFLSLLITYVLVETEIIELSRYEKLLGDQADLKTLIDVTQDLFPIEVGKKILTSFLEALFLAYGFGIIPPGSTPGKYLIGLKVIRCDTVQPVAVRDYRIIVYSDGERISFLRALTRSMIKNFSLGFLFPLCITMYVFQFNRSLYDVASGTIVVEA